MTENNLIPKKVSKSEIWRKIYALFHIHSMHICIEDLLADLEDKDSLLTRIPPKI